MITLTEAKSHLRVDGDDEDDDIARKLTFAGSIIADYVGTTAATVIQSDVIDAATLLVLGELYANRESLSNPLSPMVKLILERLRVPSFA